MNKIHQIARIKRHNTLGILDEIIYRWSPRVLSGEKVREEDLLPLFEAARWAPSSSNNQEWHYYYALKDDVAFNQFFHFLDEGNQKWYHKAGVLIVLVSNEISSYKNYKIPSHSFDTGASFENLAIEGVRRGLVVHPIGGFDKQIARETLKLNENQSIEIMIAIGWPEEVNDQGNEKEVTQRNEIAKFTTHIKTIE